MARLRFPLLCLVIVVLTFSFFPTISCAQNRSMYVSFKPGAFIPDGDIDDFGTGFSGSLSFGRQYTPNFAVEMDVGWINLDESDSITVDEIEYSGSIDLDIIPVSLNLKAILPYGNLELYGIVGIGVYFVEAEAKSHGFFDGTVDDDDEVFGFSPGLGVQYNFNQRVFMGVEGKYLFTSDVELFGVESNLNGIWISGVIGFRF